MGVFKGDFKIYDINLFYFDVMLCFEYFISDVFKF